MPTGKYNQNDDKMIYTEAQLNTISNPPFKYETQQVIRTHTRIREAINNHLDKQRIIDGYDISRLHLDIFLQGSYKNSTNVSKSSDVDVVVRLTNVHRKDLSSLTEPQKAAYERDHNDVNYGCPQFKADIQQALITAFGAFYVHPGNKSIKLTGIDGLADADVIPCFTYKKFHSYQNENNNSFKEGVFFIDQQGGMVINYPKVHYENLTTKSTDTSGDFKETVRMFKNMRHALVENRRLSDDIVKSYFIENLLYNISDNYFQGDYSSRFEHILNHLINEFNSGILRSTYVCANHEYLLIGDDLLPETDLRAYLEGLIYIKNNENF